MISEKTLLFLAENRFNNSREWFQTHREEYEKYVIPDVSSKEYQFVKYADRLSAYVKCIEEVKAGNSEFKKAKTSIGHELKKITEPAVVYYLKEFIPTFELSLDELD